MRKGRGRKEGMKQRELDTGPSDEMMMTLVMCVSEEKTCYVIKLNGVLQHSKGGGGGGGGQGMSRGEHGYNDIVLI